jgi:fucose 4-O-acetylase-like acetyltransferase
MGLLYGDVSMAEDIYQCTAVLSVGTAAALYMTCFIGKKLANTHFGKILALCGKESYYIMVLHLIGFKVATLILLTMGWTKPLQVLYSPAENLLEVFVYIMSDVVFSLFIATASNKINTYVSCKLLKSV